MLPDVYQIFKHTHSILRAIFTVQHFQPFTREPVTFKTPVVFLFAIPQHTTALSASTSGTILPLKRMA